MIADELTWYQVTAPHFCAGFGVDTNAYVRAAAPIIAWMRGKPLTGIAAYCARKHWQLVEIERADRS